MLDKNKIYCGESIELLNKLDDSTIDLVVTSPPYNVDLGNNKYNKKPYDLYQDNKEHSEYINWLKDIFSLVHKKLKHGGRVVINIGDGKNGAIPTHSDIIQFMTNEIGYIMMSTIIWNKNTVSSRTAWGSWLSPSSPSFPTPLEYIMVFAKGIKKLQHKGEIDLTKDEFVKFAYGLWTIAPETNQKKIGHPAMFPEELPYRCIKMFSYIGDLVLDPFNGAGTTCKVAKDLNREFIGFDLSEKYCNIAKERLK